MTNKTQPTKQDPREFIESVDNAARRKDALTLLDLYARTLPDPPVMWGDSLIGYGQYHYKYASGREGDYFKAGFSPRKANMVVYLMSGTKQYEAELATLGPHKLGVSCLYLGALDKIDLDVLKDLIKRDYQKMGEIYQVTKG